MKVLDPGHLYELDTLDEVSGWAEEFRQLRFVKRIGTKFPGNQPPGCPGTTTQEVLRALIDRTLYVNKQAPFWQNEAVVDQLRAALYHLEHRAAQARGENMDDFCWKVSPRDIESLSTCDRCGHIACTRTAEQHD